VVWLSSSETKLYCLNYSEDKSMKRGELTGRGATAHRDRRRLQPFCDRNYFSDKGTPGPSGPGIHRTRTRTTDTPDIHELLPSTPPQEGIGVCLKQAASEFKIAGLGQAPRFPVRGA
jgi:hypothetical protein